MSDGGARYDADWFVAILDAMQELVLVKGERSRLLWANRAFREYYDMTNDQLAELIDADHSDPDDTVQYVLDDHYVFTTGEQLRVTEPVTSADGRVRYFDTVKTAVRSDDDRVIRTVGVSRRTVDLDGLKESRRDRDERKTALEFLRELVATMPAPVIVLDVQQRILAASAAARSLLGPDASTERYLGGALAAASGVSECVERALRDGTDSNLEDVTLERNGQVRYLDVRVQPWKLPRQGSGGVILLATDVTKVRETERRLAALNAELEASNAALRKAKTELDQQNRWLGAILDTLTTGVVVADQNAEFTLWNTEASRLLGMGPEDIPIDQWPGRYGLLDAQSKLVSGEELPLVRALRGEDVRDELMIVRNPNIEVDRWISCSARLVDGDPDGSAVVVFDDITKRIETERALEEFAYVASHDLQEPLRMVRSYVQLIDEEFGDRIDGDGRMYMHYALDGARRMQQLIHDLLSYSRTGWRALEIAPVQVSAVIDDVLHDLEASIADCGGRVERSDMPVVAGDPAQIRQLFLNLLTNGLKFRHPDRAPVIRLAASRDGAGWRFDVVDNGIGLDMSYADKAFGMFQRLQRNSAHEGTGIGLAVCKRIVQRHNGTIGVDSKLGEGATFWFTLPKPSSEQDEGARSHE